MEEGSPSRQKWPAAVTEAMDAASPCRLLEALGHGPGGASEMATPSRQWADLVGEELPPANVFFEGSLELLRELQDGASGERVAISDSEDDSLSESELQSAHSPLPLSVGRGKQPVRAEHKRRRVRLCRHRKQPTRFMAAV